jgi:putative flippase GtrA
MIDRIVPDAGKRALLGQLVRYGLTGGFVTIISIAVYWILATPLHIAPLIANTIGYLVAVALGYVLHSRWSFRDHGTRDNPGRTTMRFVIASLISYGLNSLWVWTLTGLLDGPTWWPTIPMLLVTPFAMFWLNRQWVFE